MNRKPRPSKVLLFGPEPEEQARKAQIAQWCGSKMTYAHIAQLCLERYGLTVGRSQLSRFYDEIHAERAEADIMAAASEARARVQVTKDEGVNFGAALEAEFAQDLYQLKLSGATQEQLDSATDRYVKIAKANQARVDGERDFLKWKESLKSAQEKGLDALFEEVRGNPQAEKLYHQFRDCVRQSYEAKEE